MSDAPRWKRNGKQILRDGKHFADARNNDSARIIRQALWCRDWLPLACALSVAGIAVSVAL